MSKRLRFSRLAMVLLVSVAAMSFVLAYLITTPHARESLSIANLALEFNSPCTQDSECLLVPGDCSSCSCNYQSVLAVNSAAYSEARVRQCNMPPESLQSHCDMHCPNITAVCKQNQCMVKKQVP